MCGQAVPDDRVPPRRPLPGLDLHAARPAGPPGPAGRPAGAGRPAPPGPGGRRVPGHQPQHGTQGLPRAGARRPGRGPARAGHLRAPLAGRTGPGQPGRAAPGAAGLAGPGPGGRPGHRGRRGPVRDHPAGRRRGGRGVSAAVEATGLGKRYRRTWALRDCTLAIPQGRIAALVGPNGAGKTTLLHLAVGLLAPTAGAIRVLGQTPGRDPDLLGRVGFVAQDAPLYGDLNGAEHLRLGVELNRRFDQTLARDRLERLGVPLDRRVDRLSGGQRAQVALAMALAKRPELLLLDEPVASLDPLARREFLQALMGSVAEQGLTVVLSSHLLADLERVCDYLIVLQAARVQVLGPVDELLDRHRLLVGPHRGPAGIAGVAAVVRATHTARQSTLLVRTDGPVRDPALRVADVTLEDLVLAYLADPSAGTLPGPAAPVPNRLEVQA